jgi:hypothetical protein
MASLSEGHRQGGRMGRPSTTQEAGSHRPGRLLTPEVLGCTLPKAVQGESCCGINTNSFSGRDEKIWVEVLLLQRENCLTNVILQGREGRTLIYMELLLNTRTLVVIEVACSHLFSNLP